MVSYQMETTSDLQNAFLTAKKKKIGNYEAGSGTQNQKKKQGVNQSTTMRSI